MSRGRSTWAELANHLNMSSPAVAERVRRLEEQGMIKGYQAIVDASTVGLSLMAFIAVSLERPKHKDTFLSHVEKLQEVQECHHITGEDNFLLKVRCSDIKELDRIISDELRELPGVVKTHTTIVLNTYKETSDVPLK